MSWSSASTTTPAAGGSNSLKYVLPAVLEGSPFLQEKYARPIYGAPGGIPSHNFTNMVWVRPGPEGGLQDPYRLLEPVAGVDLPERDGRLFSDDELRNGGAAMTALARMQFTQMSPAERALLTAALLRYCELDTLAMVMVCEYWRQEIGVS